MRFASRDSLILSFACETTSVFAGFAIFSILGHMAEKLGVEVSSFAGTGECNFDIV